MFDLKTFKELARIPAAEDADAIVLRRTRRTACSRSTVTPHSSTVVDAAPRESSSRTFRSAASRNTARQPATARSTRT
mgnify:CR=1 FL=1